MTHPAPQADRMIRQAARNLIHLASLYGFVPTIETKPYTPLAMGNHTLQLDLRPVRNPDPAASDNCRRPHVLEKLSYYETARDDMSLEDCLSFLGNGWTDTPGRTTIQLVLQLTELLAAAPFRPYCNDDCRAYTQGTAAELHALRKKVATYEARDALGLVPPPAGELGPDGKEWAKTAAGYDHVQAMLPRADGEARGPFWYGWALRGAFVAGAEWQEARNPQTPTASYLPLTAAEARDLTCMLAGAPWPEEMLPELQRLLGIYDGLRARNQRPVDPATLPRKVAKEVMKTGVLPDTAQAVEGAPSEVNWVGTSSHHLLPRPSTSDAIRPDEEAADRFVAAMKAKLAKARAKGRSGWDSPEHCNPEKLATMLIQHVAKGDPVDVANFAMMLHQRVALGIDPAVPNQPAPLKMALSAYVESDGYWNGWGAQLQHLRDQVALALDEMGCCNYNSAAERLRHVHQETGAKAPTPRGLMSASSNAREARTAGKGLAP